MPCLLPLQELLLLSLPDLKTTNVLSVTMETRLVSGLSALVRLVRRQCWSESFAGAAVASSGVMWLWGVLVMSWTSCHATSIRNRCKSVVNTTIVYCVAVSGGGERVVW